MTGPTTQDTASPLEWQCQRLQWASRTTRKDTWALAELSLHRVHESAARVSCQPFHHTSGLERILTTVQLLSYLHSRCTNVLCIQCLEGDLRDL